MSTNYVDEARPAAPSMPAEGTKVRHYRIDRREFLRAFSGGALALASSGILAGCGGGGGGGGNGGGGGTGVSLPPPSSNPGLTGLLTLGPQSHVTDFALAGSGGTYTVTGSGTPVDGLKIVADHSAFAGATDFRVSQQAISSHTFGPLVSPIGPLITVGSDIDLASDALPLIVTIPATFSAGMVPLVLAYDAASGRLTALTVVACSASAVTVALKSFNPIFAGAASTHASPRAAPNPVLQFFVSATSIQLLPKNADSGYRPGVDDFEFPNHGTVISTGGNCYGHSCGSVWYYLYSKKAHGPLNGRSDNNGPPHPATPQIWEDDVRGIRTVAAIQASYDEILYDKILAQYLEKGIAGIVGYFGLTPDQFTYYVVLASMAITGLPSLMALWQSDGTKGHAIVIYAASSNLLFVADPNSPGSTPRYVPQTISLINGKFESFFSGLETGNGIPFDVFGCVSANDMVVPLESNLTDDFSAFEAGAASLGAFPDFVIDARNGTKSISFDSGEYTITQDTISLKAPTGYRLRIYQGNVYDEPAPDVDGYQTVNIAPAETTLGIVMFGPNPSTGKYDRWAGFEYRKVRKAASGVITVQ